MAPELAHGYTTNLAQLRLKSGSCDSKSTILSWEPRCKEDPLAERWGGGVWGTGVQMSALCGLDKLVHLSGSSCFTIKWGCRVIVRAESDNISETLNTMLNK